MGDARVDDTREAEAGAGSDKCGQTGPNFKSIMANGDTLWALLEERGAFIPGNLKKILEVTKFDNLNALLKFTIPEDLDKIVTFMRKTLHEIIDADERQPYYDIFKFKPEKFEIVPGNIIALKSLVRLAKYVVNEINNNVQNNGSFSSASTSTMRSNIAKKSKKSEEDSTADGAAPVLNPVLKLQNALDEGVSKYVKTTFPSISNNKVVSTVACDGHGSFSAVLYCPVQECNIKVKISRNDTRWNTSNFYTHIRKHFQNPEKEKEKDNNEKVTTYFKPKESETNEDDEVFPPNKKRRRGTVVITDDDSEEVDDVDPKERPSHPDSDQHF